MIILPLMHNSTPPTCPSCGRPEDKVTICRHCKHEYDSRPGFVEGVLIALLVFVIFFVGFGVIEWAIEGGTLLTVLQENVAQLWAKLKTIY